MKNRTEAPAGKLKLSEILEKPWTYLMVDFIMKLLLVAGKDAILVVCNRLSKMTHFVATTEGTSAEGLVRLFRDNVWKLHRLLESVVSDRGPQFTAELTKELNIILGIETKLSILFHPQTDGQTERMNQDVVATTHLNGTHSLLTLVKLTEGYLVVGITRELDKEPLLHCFSIYINTMWSVLQQYLSALMSMHHPHVLLLIHHKAIMLYTCALTSYS